MVIVTYLVPGEVCLYLHNSTGVPIVQFWPLSLCHATPGGRNPLSRCCVTERERGQNWIRVPGILCTVGEGTK